MKRFLLLISVLFFARALCAWSGQVALTTGAQLSGDLDVEGSRLVVRSGVDAGEVVRRFASDQVEWVRFEHESEWSEEEKLSVYATLVPYLDATQQTRLLDLLQKKAALGEYARVWEVSSALLPIVREELQTRTEKLMLLAAWQLERPEAEELAGRWIDARGIEEGALGQAIKAELLWRRGEYRAAFAVVAPVLARARPDVEYLDRCEALAVLSLLALVPETELYPEAHPATIEAGKIFREDLGGVWPSSEPELPAPKFPLFMAE